ncbi:MAG: response regulator [Planctomycetaceae bacterium]|nr:response regulator [Planctomycetaceae bacterium]
MEQKTILCVDDEPGILSALKRLLRREPYRLLTASSGEEALQVFASEKIHLIVSDHRMPGMTGTELLSEIQKISPETVRVVLSGYADAAAIVEAINRGHIFRFLGKPWSDEELKANIRACLEQYDLIAHNRSLTHELAERNEQLRRLSEQQQSLIEERTRSLQMAQEVVQALPMPIIGVSVDGLIALVNSEANSLLNFPMGTSVQEAFPENLATAVSESVRLGSSRKVYVRTEVSGQSVQASVVPLMHGHDVRGSLVLMELCPCTV